MTYGCWNSYTVTLDIIMKNDRMFHYVVQVPKQNINSFITFLYGYPQHFKQKKIWDILYSILKTLLVVLVLLLEISMKSYTPIRK